MACLRMAISVLILTGVFALLIDNVAANIVPSNSAIVGFIQSLQDPRYKLKMHPPGSTFEKDAEQETILMTDSEKRKYECTLPKPVKGQSSKFDHSQQNSSSVSLATERRVTKTPDDLLSILKDQCFIRHEGWWTYEFCYQGKVRQLHLDSMRKIVQEFILGIYDPDVTADLHQNVTNIGLQKDHRSKSAAQRYHSHIFTNGTLCDLTNDPRETEVRFVCADTGNNMISSITEASTCKYTLIFHSPVLCKHLLFQEERPQSLIINCVELVSTPEVIIDKAAEDVVISGLLPASDDQ